MWNFDLVPPLSSWNYVFSARMRQMEQEETECIHRLKMQQHKNAQEVAKSNERSMVLQRQREEKELQEDRCARVLKQV